MEEDSSEDSKQGWNVLVGEFCRFELWDAVWILRVRRADGLGLACEDCRCRTTGRGETEIKAS